MKTKKPLLVKLSAGLLVACGVALPTLGAGWTETDGNWLLTGTSTQTGAVSVDTGMMATLSSGSQWKTFDATTGSAAIVYADNGTLKMNGGKLAVTANGIDGLAGISGAGSLAINSWVSASTLSVMDKEISSSQTAYGLVWDGDISINGNLSGAVTVTATGAAGQAVGIDCSSLYASSDLAGAVIVKADASAFGLDVTNFIEIGRHLSGKVTAISTGTSSGDVAKAIRGYSEIWIAGNMAGTITATSAGTAYGIIADYGMVSIGGNLSGSIMSTGGQNAYGISGNDIEIATMASSGRITVKSTSTSPNGTARAVGVQAYDSLTIGNLAGAVLVSTAATDSQALGLLASSTININGNLSGSVTTTSKGNSAAIFAGDFSFGNIQVLVAPAPSYGGSRDIWIGNDFSGRVTATGESLAMGMAAMDNLYIGGKTSNKASVSVSAKGAGYGLGAANVVWLGGGMAYAPSSLPAAATTTDFAGTVTVAATNEAYGIFAGAVGNDMATLMVDNGWTLDSNYGVVGFSGNLSGKVLVAANAVAEGICAENAIVIDGNLSGKISAAAKMDLEGTPEGGSLGAGLIAKNWIGIGGNLAGSIDVAADRAFGLVAGNIDTGGGIEINGNLSSKITVFGRTLAFGVVSAPDFFIQDALAAPNANPTPYATADLAIGGALSGTVKVTSTDGYAIGLASSNDLTVGGALTGSVTTDAGQNAESLYAYNNLSIGGDLFGAVTATSDQYATGLDAGNNLTIGGILSGKVKATAGSVAFGLYAANQGDITINGGISGSVAATSTTGSAYGLGTWQGDIGINGVSKKGTITATGLYAYGIASGGTLDNGEGGALAIAGSVKAIGNGAAEALSAGGGLNVLISGTVSATNKSGTAYAIKSYWGYDDTVELTTGAKITGNIDLGENAAPPTAPRAAGPVPLSGGDTLILSGHGTYDAKGMAVSGIENLIVNADTTWQLGGLNSNGNFNSIVLNSGTFGFGTKELVHVNTYSFVQGSGNTLLIKLNNYDSDTITILPGGSYTQDGVVRFVKFGSSSRTSCTWLIDHSGFPGASVKMAPSALFDSTVTSETTEAGTAYSVDVTRRSLAPMASAGNQGIANALNQAFDNGQGDSTLTSMAMMAAPREIDSELSKFQPISAPTYVTLSGSQKFTAGVGSHIEAIRQGMTMASRPVKTNLPTLAGTGDTAIGEILQAARAAASETTEWQVSGRYLSDFGRLNSDGTAAGNQWKTNGFMVDLDRQINSNLMIGIAAGGSWSNIDIRRDSGDAETTSLNTRLYAAWFDGPWHADAQIGYGYNWNESKRRMIIGNAKGKWNSDLYTAYLGGGYDLELGNGWILDPNAALEYTRIQEEGYDEHGTDANLSVDSKNYDSLRHLLGMALRKGFTLDNKMVIRPEARLTWAHEYMDTTVRSSASLFGNSFTTNGVKQDRDSAILGLGLNLQFNETVGGYVSYDAELSSNKTSQGVSVGIRFNF